MNIIINISLILAAFVMTEFVAWFLHKYLMHGILWNIHYDHHNLTGKKIQKNDLFMLVFAIPSWLLIMFGMMNNFDYKLWLGIGILLYGIVYFLFHDVLIHKRHRKLRRLIFSDVSSSYLNAVIKAHHAHHKHINIETGESFGMLFVHPKYFSSK